MPEHTGGYFSKIPAKKALADFGMAEMTGAEKFWYVLQCIAFGADYFAKLAVAKTLSEMPQLVTVPRAELDALKAEVRRLSDRLVRFAGDSWQEIEALPQPVRWTVQRAIFHLLDDPVPALADPFPNMPWKMAVAASAAR